jgi:intermediate cleaving peptidase 55
MSRNAIEELFPHHLSHYVGLDVHDTPGYGRGRVLEEGMCVTVEPGIYVPVGDERWPRAFWGMGVRVEDCVVVGAEGPYVLTTEAVKEVSFLFFFLYGRVGRGEANAEAG